MATTWRGEGRKLSDTAPAAFTVKTPLDVEDVLLIPVETAASGADVSAWCEDEHNFPKDGNAASLGQIVYWDDANSRVTAVKSASGNKPIGICSNAAASGDSTMDVKLLPAVQIAPFAYGLQGAGTQLNSQDTTETAHADSLTIPTELFKAGGRIKLRALVKVDNQNSTNTILCKLKIGSVVLASNSAVDPGTGDHVALDAEINVQSIGASGEIHARGNSYETATPAAATTITSDQTLDTTSDATVTVSATWSAGHADNASTLKELVCEIWP